MQTSRTFVESSLAESFRTENASFWFLIASLVRTFRSFCRHSDFLQVNLEESFVSPYSTTAPWTSLSRLPLHHSNHILDPKKGILKWHSSAAYLRPNIQMNVRAGRRAAAINFIVRLGRIVISRGRPAHKHTIAPHP